MIVENPTHTQIINMDFPNIPQHRTNTQNMSTHVHTNTAEGQWDCNFTKNKNMFQLYPHIELYIGNFIDSRDFAVQGWSPRSMYFKVVRHFIESQGLSSYS